MTLPTFTNPDNGQHKRVWMLLVPMMVEQFVNVLTGFLNAVMVSRAGEAALSAISLVDTITLLLMQVFTALSAGGAILAAQYMGRQDFVRARRTANLTALMALAVSLSIGLLTCLFSVPMLRAIYPTVTGITFDYSVQYLVWSAASFPLFALYGVGVSLLYAEGSSRASMYATLALNATKIVGNLVFINGMGMAVSGAGAATLLARLVGAVMVTKMLLNHNLPLHYAKPWLPKEPGAARLIVKVAVPSGLENFLFLLAKLLIGTVIATFSGAMIAANAAANTISGFVNIPSGAINLATVTIVGQAVGAGLYQNARNSAKRLMKLSYLAQLVMCLALFVFVKPVTAMLNLSPEAFETTVQVLRLYCVMAVLFEPIAFGLPNALRAAGDLRHTMVVAVASAFLVRAAFSYLLVYGFGMTVHGIWIAMYLDWIARGILFVRRFRGDKWLTKALV